MIPRHDNMLPRMAQTIASIAAILYFAFFLSKADSFLYYHGLLDTAPILIFVCGGAPVLLFAVFKARALRLLRPGASVLVPLCWCVIVALVVGITVQTRISEVRLTHEFLVTAGLFVFGLLAAAVEWVRSGWRWATGMALAATCGTIVWDFIMPGSFSLFNERAAGFAENPNVGALTAVLLLASFVAWDQRKLLPLDVIAMLATGAAVVLTQSRGGILVYGFAVASYVWSRQWRRGSVGRVVVVMLVAIPAIVFLAGAALVQATKWASEVNVFRSDMVHDESTEERSDALRNGLSFIDSRVWVGWGNGFVLSMRVGPHNMYVARWIDNGAVGLAVYCWWLLALVVSSWRLRNREAVALAVICVGYGFLSHNLHEDRTLLIVLGYAIAKGLVKDAPGSTAAVKEGVLHSAIASTVEPERLITGLPCGALPNSDRQVTT